LTGGQAFAVPAAVWTRSLADQGYDGPLEAAGRAGDLDLSWVVPEPARTGTGQIALDIDTLTSPGFAGVLTLSVNGRNLESRALAPGRAVMPLRLALPRDIMAMGAIRLRLHYAAALQGGTCGEARLGSVSLALAPGSALQIMLPPDAAATPEAARALLPAALALALPADLSDPALYRRALLATAALIAGGHRIHLASAEEADLRFDPAASVPRFEPSRKGPPRLVLPLADPVPRAERAGTVDSLPLRAFEGASGLREASPLAEWRLFASRGTIPADKIPAALALSFTSGAEGAPRPHILHLFVNGTLAGSAELRRTGVAETVELPIPPGLALLDNAIALRFEREGPCVADTIPLPVELAPASRLILADAPRRTGEFLDVARQAALGLTLYLSADERTDPARSLPLLAGLLAHYGLADGAGVRVETLTGGPLHPPGAFVLMGHTPPPGAEMALREGGTAAALESHGALIAQLDPHSGGFALRITVEDRPGIWLAPPRDGAPASGAPLKLEHGDLALIDAGGLALWTNTAAKDGFRLRYAEAGGLGPLFARAWPFGVTLLWALVTLAFLITLARLAVRK
jgi:hypothetical protein